MDPGQQGEAIVWLDEARVRRTIIRGRVLEVASAPGGVVVSWGGGLVAGYGYAPDGRIAVTKPSRLDGAPPTTELMAPNEGERQMMEAGLELPGLGVLHLGPMLLWAWRVYQARCAEIVLMGPPPQREAPPEARARPSLLTH